MDFDQQIPISIMRPGLLKKAVHIFIKSPNLAKINEQSYKIFKIITFSILKQLSPCSETNRNS